MQLNKWFVFDVESLGLYGEPYAVAWQAVDFDLDTVTEGMYAIDRRTVTGSTFDRQWAATNVPDLPVTHLTQDELLDDFWAIIQHHIALGFNIAAEVPVPVESNLLRKCVDIGSTERCWDAPYPLYDIASIMLASGMDPLTVYTRLSNELPVHHPLCDVRQSVRLLRQALNK